MKGHLSPRQIAEALGVSESSLKRWCDQGMLPTVRTAGGHRRVEIAAALRFMREKGYVAARPELLGLARAEDGSWGEWDSLTAALEGGDERGVTAGVVGLYVAGRTISALCDDLIAPALHEIGERWSDGSCEVYQERRAVGLVLRALGELRDVVAEPPPDAPRALGATLSGDHYGVPVAMGELVLRDAGWSAQLLGTHVPVQSCVQAVARVRPRIAWVSVSFVPDEQALATGFGALFASTEAVGAALVVGGRALDPDLRTRLSYTAHCDRMADLRRLAGPLAAVRGSDP